MLPLLHNLMPFPVPAEDISNRVGPYVSVNQSFAKKVEWTMVGSSARARRRPLASGDKCARLRFALAARVAFTPGSLRSGAPLALPVAHCLVGCFVPSCRSRRHLSLTVVVARTVSCVGSIPMGRKSSGAACPTPRNDTNRGALVTGIHFPATRFATPEASFRLFSLRSPRCGICRATARRDRAGTASRAARGFRALCPPTRIACSSPGGAAR